jgi:hypothetical protein
MKTLIRIVGSLIVAYFAASAMAQVAPAAAPAANLPAAVPAAQAKETGPKLTLMLSPYTYHFNPKPTHKDVILVGLEREYASRKLDGAALFTNSFGQPSIYVYPWGGVYKSILGVEKLSFKWTGGIIYGYRGEFKDEVANVGGFAPVVVFGLNYEFKPGWSAQVNTLGLAAAQFQLNIALD